MDPVIRRAAGAIEAVGRAGAGPPLGVDAHAVYRPVTIALEPGDLVVLYTDGVTDALNREDQPFGEERLLQTLAAAPQGAAAAGEAILASVRDHSTGRKQFDDITIVGFSRL
jgi:serine phosphatase RsbU (regulator of sigma subunit)